MVKETIFWLIAWAPLAVTLASCIYLHRKRRAKSAGKFTLLALWVTTANAAWAAWHFSYFELETSRLPAWENEHVLRLGLLFLSAPVGLVLALIAATRGTYKGLALLLALASVPLLLLAIMAGIAV